jgi:hypothetical protein
MLQTIKAYRRQFADYGWLKTHWLFSFSEYYDPNNIQFGNLRVFNDDIIAPKSGFPTHSHREIEIVTIVLAGEITHQDSTGAKEVIKAGDVQRMSAGRGIAHSEFNLGQEPVHLYQIWFYPNISNVQPGYEQKTFASILEKNALIPLVSGKNVADVVKINSDASIYVAELDSDRTLEFKTDKSRGTFIYITEGDLEINGQRFKSKDQARIGQEQVLHLKAYEPTKFLLIDVSL